MPPEIPCLAKGKPEEELKMCLSKAYVGRHGEMELFFEEVASLEIEKGKILLKTLFGEQKEIWAHIKEIDFLEGKIFLEKAK